jgi:hypothetical protein
LVDSPLGRREKLAYECLWLADPSYKPTTGMIFTLTFCLLMVYFLDLICFVSYTALTQEEIGPLVTRLFNQDPLTPQLASLIFFIFIAWQICLVCVLQGLYPNHHTDVELSNSDDDVLKTNSSVNKQKMTTGNDAKGGGVSLAEQIAPNPISSSVPEQAKPPTTDQVDVVAPSTSKQKWKLPLPMPKRKPSL